MTRMTVRAGTLVLATLLATGTGAAGAPVTLDAARRAVEATLDMIPADDIHFDYRPVQIRVADLDRSGTRGVVYVYTATTSGSTVNQPNELVVMTALGPGDRRGWSAYPGKVPTDDQALAIIRAAGYADDVSVHVPGDVTGLEVVGGEIRVSFENRLGSPICKRDIKTGTGGPLAHHCPPPGKHSWRYRWAPGHLIRLDGA